MGYLLTYCSQGSGQQQPKRKQWAKKKKKTQQKSTQGHMEIKVLFLILPCSFEHKYNNACVHSTRV